MTKSRQPTVSIILATHNRRAVVCDTLSRLASRGLDRKTYELIVVDNASTDGTPGAIAANVDLLIPLDRNHGSCAKSYGVDRARGRYILFLDDDSCPRAGSVERMIERFDAAPDLAAAGFTVFLPSGRREGAALPHVFVGCGVGLRAEALRSVGGLDRSFFMQAEEYDLCFRLASAGWLVRMFDDLHVDHRKTPTARRPDRTMFYDIRNNLRVAARYFPHPQYREYRRDWLLRYQWLAESHGQLEPFRRGRRSGSIAAILERHRYRNRRLPAAVWEEYFCPKLIATRMRDLSQHGAKRVVLAGLGKNIFPFVDAARRCDLDIPAIGDDRFAAPNRRYRNIPVIPFDEAMLLGCDAVVVTHTGPVHADATAERLRSRCAMPIHDWFGNSKPTEQLDMEPVPSSADATKSDAVCAVRG
ncbi:MAG: glycosyltransferase family 2 protein [Planctomycetes bacterium]|nr:glycosyltransferase family 2 protein [Planctomycetota bacterium]